MEVLLHSLTLLLVLITSIRPSSSKESNSEAYWENTYVDVSGRHLNACVSVRPGIFLPVVDATTGNITSYKGTAVPMINYFCEDTHCTFDYVYDILGGVTPFSLLKPEYCDVYLRASLFLEGSDRYDYLHPYVQSELMMLIPMPEPLAINIDAVWKPFQPYVWLVLLIMIPIAAFGLAIADYLETGKFENFWILYEKYGSYVMKSLASQGASYSDSFKWKLRFALGAWLLASFVLVSAYSSVLISFILTPHFEQLISTVKELAERSDLQPVMIKGGGPEVLILSSIETYRMQVAAKLLAHPENRVSSITKCADEVRKGGKVCIDVYSIFLIESVRDYAETGKCLVHVIDDHIGRYYFGWMVNKGSPLREAFNRKIAKMLDHGLVSWWYKLSSVFFKPPHCFEVAKSLLSGKLISGPPRLSLGSLAGPFCILLIGYLLSTFTFIVEKIVHYWKANNSNNSGQIRANIGGKDSIIVV